MRSHSDAWVNWFETNAPETEYFLYLIDESNDYAQIQQWAQWINNNPGPGHHLLSLATMPLPATAANTSVLDLPTSWFNVGLTDTWQNAVDGYRSQPDKRVFFYNSNRPGSGSFAIEDDGGALRELAWGEYKMNIQRWFYWQSVYYNNFQGNTGQTNMFQTAHTFGSFDRVGPDFGEIGGNYLNGDGVLFYPGTDLVFSAESYGVKEPFASLGLKHWRRRIQDVDDLDLEAKVDPGRVQQIVERMVPKVLWEIVVTDPGDPTWVLSDISWSTDPDDWEAASAELADIIESGPSEVERRDHGIPECFALFQNDSNPFKPATTISSDIHQADYVTLKIFNLRGEKMVTLVSQALAAGCYSTEWRPPRPGQRGE